MKIFLIISVLLTLGACGFTQDTSVTKTMREAAIGTWSVDENECKHSQTYSFSDNGDFMLVYSDDGLIVSEDGRTSNTSKYRILSESNRAIRAAIEGEYRKTEDGTLVVWDMFLINDNEFCWHRTDWTVTACTGSMYRCRVDS